MFLVDRCTIFFSFETYRLNLARTRLSYTILCCIIGVLKKSFEPAVNVSRDRTTGEHFVSCTTELSATPFYIRILLLCIFSTGMLVHFFVVVCNSVL
jgi:ditrans,polycis-polyprenyl diphosphate synthase